MKYNMITFFPMIFIFLVLFSCTYEEHQVSVPVSYSRIYQSRIVKKQYEFNVTTEIMGNSQEWFIGQKLPLKMEEAVTIAEKEIANYDTSRELWLISDVSLCRLGTTNKWFHVVHFEKRQKGIKSDDYLYIPVLFNGQAIKGELK
jgi:hypothetical protein